MKGDKLYKLTTSDFKAFSYLGKNGRIGTAPADNVPMIRWPDGRWCWLANIHMQELYTRGLSRKDRGGTLLTYASNISPLIRYCFRNRIDFTDLTDNEFKLFIKTLLGERRSDGSGAMVRDANAALAIGRSCINFLACVGKFYDDDNFVGPKGRIKAERKRCAIRVEGMNKTVFRIYWHHSSFPGPDPKKKRLPISTETLEKLTDAVLPASGTIYLRKRRYVMIKVLEITGARRSEVASLTVESVRAAARMEEPMLELITAKQSGGVEAKRMVPIATHDIRLLMEFININRRQIIKKTCGIDNDDGFLLISETTGKRIKPNTITQEISLLCIQAGINVKACPHMFRHRFITKWFVALLEWHRFENEDEFRRALLDTATFKQQLQQWTGHKNINSLDIYLHLAFEEAAHYKKTYNIVNAARVLDSLSISIRQIKAELSAGMTTVEATIKLQTYMDAALMDIERTKEAAQ